MTDRTHQDRWAEPDDDPVDGLTSAPDAAEVLGLASLARPRPELRDRVLAAAADARAAGRPATPVESITRAEGFRRMLGDLGGLVDSLTEADSRRPSVEGWTVAGLLGHLIAIEEHFGAIVGWWPETGPIELEHDHLAMTTDAARAAEAAPFDDVRVQWHEVVDRVLARLDSLEPRLEERIQFHGFDFSIRSLLIARTFEVWTHGEDICRAIGRPPIEPDSARFQLMTDGAVHALPLGMLLTGREHAHRSVRIVLTGDGGGSWVQALEYGAEAGEPEFTLVADAIDFCRVAAKRKAAAELDCTIIGDAATAEDVLVAVAVFAA